jgi:hypothetical protein
VGCTLAATGNRAGGAALAGDRLERLDFTHHPCLGLDRDPPYSAMGHAVLPIAGKGGSDWGYAIVPILGPLIGGGLAGMFLRAIAN